MYALHINIAGVQIKNLLYAHGLGKDMHRVIFLRIGGKRLHLLKMVGSLVLVGAAMGVLGTIAGLFRLIKQLELAQTNAQVAMQIFGLMPEALTSDIMLGFFMEPSAGFMFWLALFIVGAMIYRSGSIVIPIDEEIEESKKD